MQVRWSEAHRVAVLDPQGDLGIRTMVEMKNAVSNLLRDGCRVLIVDCRGVQRLEAMSLGVLVERLCRAREMSGTLALANLSADLTARLDELRVHSLFPTFDSVAAALEGLVGAGLEGVLSQAA
ncbi:MAG TPA: STAS domain-containing protein [Candidatus Methylomirabilis sp.]|jgi:anti-anti-sigma factor